MQIEYTIRFEQPWRVGSGEGAGPFLDQRVRRDGFGLPFLPGTSLQGLVADAVRRLCCLLGVEICDGTIEPDPGGPLRALCGVNRTGWCPVCALTGSPHHDGAARFGAAEAVLTSAGRTLDKLERRRRVADEAALLPGFLARSHPRTSIDRHSGRAADERFYSIEEASGSSGSLGAWCWRLGRPDETLPFWWARCAGFARPAADAGADSGGAGSTSTARTSHRCSGAGGKPSST